MSAQPITLPLRAYLRMVATSCVDNAGRRGMLLRLGDVAKLFPDGLTAVWLGDEGTAFLQQHQAELAAGRCVDIAIYNVRADAGEVRARISQCQILPPHMARQKPAAAETPPHQPAQEKANV